MSSTHFANYRGICCVALLALVWGGCQSPGTTAKAGSRSSTAPSTLSVASRAEAPAAEIAPGTLWSEYDSVIVEVIHRRWRDLVPGVPKDYVQKGKVTVEFRLVPDGRALDVKVVESNVSSILEALCLRSINESQPFLPWTNKMRESTDQDHHDVRFTF